MTTLAAIRQAVREEVRTELLLHGPTLGEYPPPSEIESEELIISALLAGDLTLQDIAPLRACDFYRPLHQAIVVAVDTLNQAKRDVTITEIVVALGAQDCAGAGLIDALMDLRARPYVLRYRDHVARIHEAAERRRICEWLRDIDKDLRLGNCTAAEARERIKHV
jgi:replicative DNA helicase